MTNQEKTINIPYQVQAKIRGYVTVTKSEFIDAVAAKTGMSKTDSSKAIDAIFHVIEDTLKKGGDVRLVNIGTFCVVKRKATEGRNPLTGEKIKIPATTVPKFKPGKGFKEAVAGR